MSAADAEFLKWLILAVLFVGVGTVFGMLFLDIGDGPW